MRWSALKAWRIRQKAIDVRLAKVEIQLAAHEYMVGELTAGMRSCASGMEQLAEDMVKVMEANADAAITLVELVDVVAQGVGQVADAVEVGDVYEGMMVRVSELAARHRVIMEAKRITYEEGTDDRDVGG